MVYRRVRKNKKITLHSAITALVVVFAFLGIGITLAASQQRTQTESDASEIGCAKDPTLSVESKPNRDRNYYTLKIKNNDKDSKASRKANCKNDSYRIDLDLPGNNWHGTVLQLDYIWKINDIITIREGESKEFRVKINSPDNTANREYKISIRAVNRANPNAADSITLTYGDTSGSGNSRDRSGDSSGGNSSDDNCTSNPNLDYKITKTGKWSGTDPLYAGREYMLVNLKITNNCLGGAKNYKISAKGGTWKLQYKGWNEPLVISIVKSTNIELTAIRGSGQFSVSVTAALNDYLNASTTKIINF